jgi:TonB family protein
MKIPLFCALLFLTTITFAQEKPATIIRDTINLRGYIYQSDGKPAKYEYLESCYSQTEYSNYNFKLATRADTNGYFELKGACPYDTLILSSHELYNGGPYYNKGSRYMIIYLPPLKTFALNTDTPIIISRKRVGKKAKAIYHPEHTNILIDFMACCYTPLPKGGWDRKKRFTNFIDSVKAHINYPVNAITHNIEGTVIIGFTIEKDGSLAYFKVLQGIGYGCDEEVVNAIRRMPKWVPGIDSGRPVAIKQMLSVEFKLTDR